MTKPTSANTDNLLIKQLEEDTVDMDFVTALSGERQTTEEEKKRLEQVLKRRGEAIYHDILLTLTMLDYPAKKAKRTWTQILQHREILRDQLQRDPGIVVAALDYLSHIAPNSDRVFRILPRNKFDTIIQRAVVDGLTNLYDHETFYSLLGKEVDRAARYRHSLSLLMIDIDDFKQINDSFGHKRGDEVLVKTAETIKENSRDLDTCGRYGGEEFAVILPHADAEYAFAVAERIRKNIKLQEIQGVTLTVSIGVAGYPDHSADIEELVQAADNALYRAKHAGKDRVVCAHAGEDPDNRG